jgi:acyl transferase domain-containing protein
MPRHAVAIVGLAGRFPGASDLDAFWHNIVTGVDCLTDFSEADLDDAKVPPALRAHPAYVRQGTALDEAEHFDAAFFGISPGEAQITDPQHRIFLECAWEALEHAGYAVGDVTDSVGVFAGAGFNSYAYFRLVRNPAITSTAGEYQVMLGNDKDFLCTRVSYKLDLRGPSMSIQTACSTSLVAVHAACRALQRGECDMALAGGVSVPFPQRAGYLYQQGMILSPDGRCRPFDVDARGTRPGAGAGIVVLKRLDDALADGDTIHAVIRGIAVNNDGAAKAGYTAPSIEGQMEAIAMAQALAGVSPRSIRYVEAHGTATPLGDPIEVAALTRVFRAETDDVGFCRLGSLKANLGHLDAAAGVAGLIKAVLVLQRRTLPPLVHFSVPNPALQLERSPFTASAAAETWVAEPGTPRRAAVSSFGIGGTNAHAVLEEAPTGATSASTTPQLLVLSARSETAMKASTERLAAHLMAHPSQDLADVAWTLQRGRVGFLHRRALVASDRDDAIRALRSASGVAGQHEGGVPRVAFLFSGQGSQYAGMGRGLYASQPAYREALDQCADILQPQLGEDLRTRLLSESGDALDQTWLTQPALFAVEYALARLWRHWGVEPSAMLGHSLGEYVAAHLAGVMSLPDALALVAARGRLMQQQRPGSMAAVHLSAEALTPWLSEDVEIAAMNAPASCTVAGPTAAIAELLARMRDAGIDARSLRTSHAFHSRMMDPALDEFTAVVRSVALAPPAVPYVSNLTGTWITAEQATSPAYYAEHMRRAVRFSAGLAALAADPSRRLLEVGPGATLTSLARLNGDAVSRSAVSSLGRVDESAGELPAMLRALGALWVGGVVPTWSAVHGRRRMRVPLPTYPFERRRHAVDPAPPAAAESANVPRVGRRTSRIEEWAYAPTWSRDDSIPAPVSAATWLVLGDANEITGAVRDALASRGVTTVSIERGPRRQRLTEHCWSVSESVVADVEAVLRELPDSASGVQGVVLLWGLATDTTHPPLSAADGYDLVVALAGTLPSRGPRSTVLHVTAGLASVMDEPVNDHRAALAVGPALVLPTEVPGVSVRVVDLVARGAHIEPSAAATAVAAEVGRLDQEPLVAWRSGRRWVRRYERMVLAPVAQAAPFKPGGCYLITGGVGGIGLALARWLGEALQARLLLTARSGLPPRDTWTDRLRTRTTDDRVAAAIDAIRAVEAAGGEVLVAAADVTDVEAMSRAVSQARQRFGRIDGFVHAAGVAGTAKFAQLARPDEVRQVWAAKVDGLDTLVSVLGAEPLDFAVLMSSISSVVGNPGAADYTAANAVLDAFVDSAARPEAWRQVVAINWGAWRDVGMAATRPVSDALRPHWDEFLAGAIAPDAGIEALRRVLATGRRRVVIDTYDVVHATEIARRVDAGHPTSTTRVEPSEVEAALLTLPAVRHAAVVGHQLGSSEVRLVAYLVFQEGETLTSSEVRRHLRGSLPRHMIPSLVVTLDALPRTPNGELDRGRLPDPFREAAAGEGFIAPAPGAEEDMARLWCDILGIDRVGADDNFFEIGGHSLLALRVTAAVEIRFGRKVDPRLLFFRTLRQFTTVVVSGAPESSQ